MLELPNEQSFDNSEINEADASAVNSANEFISWAKFILTDDLPNENKHRVKQEEFKNLIDSGTYMPFKMAYEKPKDDHSDAFPLGVIAHLKQAGNQVIALAALWKKEREEDIAYIKECIANKIPVNVSWEIMHEDSAIGEDGVEDLIGTSLRGVTIVGRPAYAGRTPVLQVASTNGENSNSEENTLDELDTLKEQVKTLETERDTIKNELEALKASLTEKETELTGLREYKAGIEKAEQENAKFLEIKALFETSGISKPDTYFEENKEKLMAMSKSDLEFMVQEAVSLASSLKTQSASSGTGIPAGIPGTESKKLDVKELANALRNNK